MISVFTQFEIEYMYNRKEANIWYAESSDLSSYILINNSTLDLFQMY